MSWMLLETELGRWASEGRRATLWWRDDDAARDSPGLQRLLAIAKRHRTPVVVAAIPATADSSLVEAIARCDQCGVVQHGYAHRNHAPAGERSAELGPERALRVRLDEVERGRERLAASFGERFTAMLVPPWNRIGDDMAPALRAAGFAGLSCFGPRAHRSPAPGLAQVNAHVDLIAWRRGRAFIGSDSALERLVLHLAARRTARVDPGEPTGILTHHLDLSDAAFAFVDELLARTQAHAAAAWLDARAALEASDSRDRAGALTSSRSA